MYLALATLALAALTQAGYADQILRPGHHVSSSPWHCSSIVFELGSRLSASAAVVLPGNTSFSDFRSPLIISTHPTRLSCCRRGRHRAGRTGDGQEVLLRLDDP